MSEPDTGNAKPESGAAHRPATVRLHVSKGWVITMVVLLVVTWGLVMVTIGLKVAGPATGAGTGGGSFVTAAPTATGPAAGHYSCPSGPWGELDCLAIKVEPPEEFISLTYLKFDQRRWTFRDYTQEKLAGLFKEANLTPAQAEALLKNTEWNATINGCIITPDDDTVLNLSAGSRAVLYGTLSYDPENMLQNDPFRYRADLVNDWLEGGSLAEPTIALVRRLLYQRGLSAVFSDAHLVLGTLPNPDDRIRLLKTLARQATMVITLQLRPDTKLDPIVQYWGKGGTAKDIRPLLESLTKIPGGCALDVVHLLPRFARERLYTYPILVKGEADPHHDCHWSSLNFFNDPPDEKFANTATVATTLESDYVPVTGDYQLGDVILFMANDTSAIHSCVYIAGDVVFTKNGPSLRAPWILMHLPNLVAYYQSGMPLKIRAYRPKNWPTNYAPSTLPTP